MTQHHSEFLTTEDLHLLQEGTVSEKSIIIQKLRNNPDPRMIAPLIDTLMSGREELFEEIAQTLIMCKTEIIPILKQEISNHNCFIRWGVVLSIQKLAEPDLIRDLIPAIGFGYEPVVELICQTLVKLMPRRFPYPELQDVLQYLSVAENIAVGKNTIMQLGMEALDIIESQYALKILNHLNWDGKWIPILKVSHHTDYRIRQEAQRILQQCPEKLLISEASKILEEGINGNPVDFTLPGEENFAIYYYAIEALGYSNDLSIRKKLLRFLHQGNSIEKIFALVALEKLAQKHRAIDILWAEIQKELQNLLHIPDRIPKIRILKTLAVIHEEWATTAIFLYLKDSDSEIRQAVAKALMNKSDMIILEKAASLLIDEQRIVRLAAVALYRKLDSRFFPYNEGDIVNLLPAPVRIEILNQLTEGLLTKTPEYREFAAFWLGILHYEPSFQALISNLSHPVESVVNSCIVALGMFGNREAIKFLIPLFYHENARIAHKAIESVGSLGLDGFYYLLHELFQRPETPPFLLDYVQTFGGRIMNYLTQEIDAERNGERKQKLMEYYFRVSQRFEIINDKNFKVLL